MTAEREIGAMQSEIRQALTRFDNHERKCDERQIAIDKKFGDIVKLITESKEDLLAAITAERLKMAEAKGATRIVWAFLTLAVGFLGSKLEGWLK